MKRKKLLLKITMLVVSVCFVFQIFAACKPTPEPVVVDNRLVNKADIDNLTTNVNFNLAVFHNKDAAISYSKTTDYAAANGKNYRTGDIKPVWEALSNKLNFAITDKAKTYATQTDLWTAVKSDSFEGFDLLTANASDINTEATTNGTFLDMAPYLEYMPNLKKTLESHDIIKQSVFVGKQMYYAPYFDGFDDIERMMILRADWVRALLDGTLTELDDVVVDSLGFAYKPYIESYSNVKLKIVDPADSTKVKEITKNVTAANNIIVKQNGLTNKTGENLAKELRDYINATYPGLYTKPSELFLSASAAYDTDELVALLRVVKANPLFLTGDASKVIVPIYPRGNTNDRTMDIVRLAQMFGLRGVESRNEFLFVDKDGNLQDSRQLEKTYDTLEIMNTLYKDGLILQNYTSASAVQKDDTAPDLKSNGFREHLNAQNRGFLTYDYNQTTTTYNSTIRNNLTDAQKANFKNSDDFELLPVLPPFTKWDNNATVSRFTESWRSVKPNGWAINAKITKDPVKLARALKMVDYLYSEEGNKLMSYGPDEWIDGTIKYNGVDVPKLSAAALKELQDYAGGNYTNYYRQYLGATMPIGYIKEQGMEYQCTDEFGRIGLDNIFKAIRLGVMSHLKTNSASVGGDKTLIMIPTALPLTKEEQAIIVEKCTVLRENFDMSSAANKAGNNWFAKIIINGYGTTAAQIGTKAQVLAKVKGNAADQLNGETYIGIQRDAYGSIFN